MKTRLLVLAMMMAPTLWIMAQQPADSIVNPALKASGVYVKESKNDLLRKYVNIAQLVSKDKMVEMNGKQSRPEYEEYVSVAIIATQALIKGKSLEELQELMPWRLAASLEMSLNREMCERYEFIKNKYQHFLNYADSCKGTLARTGFYYLMGLVRMVSLYDTATQNEKYAWLAKELSPYVTYARNTLSKSDNIKMKELEKFLSDHAPASEWLEKYDLRSISSQAFITLCYATQNLWGMNDMVFEAQITPEGFLHDNGFEGKYYLLEYGEWNINSKLPLLPFLSEINKQPRYCLLYADGKVHSVYIDSSSSGMEIRYTTTDKDVISRLKLEYLKEKNKENGEMNELFDENEVLKNQ